MSNKFNFNIIEIHKTNNTEDIKKSINAIINKLIKKEFTSSNLQ